MPFTAQCSGQSPLKAGCEEVAAAFLRMSGHAYSKALQKFSKHTSTPSEQARSLCASSGFPQLPLPYSVDQAHAIKIGVMNAARDAFSTHCMKEYGDPVNREGNRECLILFNLYVSTRKQ